MNPTLEKQKRFSDSLSMLVVGMIGLIFVILTVASILQTSRIDPTTPSAELILFEDDLAAVNIALIVLTLLGFIAVRRRDIRLSRVDTRFVLLVMLLVTTMISLVWVISVKSVATGEARIILDSAKGAAHDDYSGFTKGYYNRLSYYQYYPSQLGYVFFAEIIYRIFGTECSDLFFQIPNIVALDFAYVGLVMITDRVFKRRAVTNMTAIALTLCLQPMFMTTYTSPILLGLGLAVWSIYFTVRYMQDNKLKYAGIATLLILFAVVLRFSYVIVLAAICFALILHTVGTKRFLALVTVAVMVVCSICVQKLVIYSYSQRSHVAFDSGISPTIEAYVGISESTMAPGWFNWNGVYTVSNSAQNSEDHQPDHAAAVKAAREQIGQRVSELSAQNRLAEFYKKKVLSQFNEPFMESVWISQTRGHDLDYQAGEKLSPIVNSVYNEGFATLLDRWFPYWSMIVYFGFAAGMLWMILRRKLSPAIVILPAAVLGAVLYHTVGEAKSLYFLPYYVMLIPFAMYGLLETTDALKPKAELLFGCRKNAPADKPAPNKPEQA